MFRPRHGHTHPKPEHVLRFAIARRSYIQQIEADMHKVLREVAAELQQQKPKEEPR